MNNASYQLLMLIATPKLADQAAEMFLKHDLPIQYRLNGEGTASNEIMDALGLGSIDKCILISMVQKEFGNEMLRLLHSRLRLDAVNSGIAFTIPLTGTSSLLMRLMKTTGEKCEQTNGKGDLIMPENKYTLITVVLDRGFSSEVMETARAAGAGGGTILHSRSIENEEATGFWGLSPQEEKEIILILAEHQDKLKIMSAISEKYGMQSRAKGLVLSLPIDSVMGI